MVWLSIVDTHTTKDIYRVNIIRPKYSFQNITSKTVGQKELPSLKQNSLNVVVNKRVILKIIYK